MAHRRGPFIWQDAPRRKFGRTRTIMVRRFGIGADRVHRDFDQIATVSYLVASGRALMKQDSANCSDHPRHQDKCRSPGFGFIHSAASVRPSGI